MPADQFDKDFGYLMPFLDKIASAAAGLPDSAARTELTRLVADEKQRWTRIRQLLSGSPSASQNASSAGPVSVAATAPASPTTRPTLTVGSLRPKRD